MIRFGTGGWRAVIGDELTRANIQRVALALALGAGLEASPMPYATELAPVLTGAALLFVFGLIGASVAVFRVTRTDPLTALGENR